MLVRVLDDERAKKCDNLLTKLIHDEKQYDDSIDKNYVVKDYFINVIKDKNNILICDEEKDVLKGYIYLKYIDNDNGKGYLIDGLYVEEKYRNRGIASNLIERALTMVKDEKIDYIDINVMANNMDAINLYKRFGFSEFRIGLRKDI